MGNINGLNKINSFVDVSRGIHLFKIGSCNPSRRSKCDTINDNQ